MKKVLRIECNLLSVVWFIFYIQSCLLSLYFVEFEFFILYIL